MKQPIPDDFSLEDGEWMCVQIQWPKSVKWIGILNGVLSSFARGRVWKESTGSITGAQEIGREIWYRNFPLTDCDGDVVPDGPGGGDGDDQGYSCGGLIVIQEDEEMGQVVTKVWIDEDTGELVVEYGPCCVQRYDLTVVANEVDQPPDAIWDDLDPQPTYSACGKVTAWMDALWSLGNAMWDYFDDEADYERRLKEAVPNAGLSRWEIYVSIAQMYILEGIYDKSTIMSAELWQRFKCEAVSGIAPTSICTEAEADYISDSIGRVIDRQFGLVNSELIKGFFYRMGGIIGKNDLKNIATLGAVSTNNDCSCPDAADQETSQTEAGYYFGAARTVQVTAPGGFNSEVAVFMEAVPHDVYGVAWKAEYVSGDPLQYIKRANDATPQAGYDVWMFGSNSDSDGADEWFVQCTDNAWSGGGVSALLDGTTHYNNFQCDDAPNEVAAAGQLVLAKFAVRAQGDPASTLVNVKLRWLHNAEDGS